MILEHNGSLTSLRAERAEGCEMAKISAGDLKALLSAERYDALSAMAASKLSDERASALNYYMGNMSKDMPAPDGRSKAISSDVADTIEGLMPPLMEMGRGIELVNARLADLQARYRRGAKAPPELLSPKSRATLDKLRQWSAPAAR
jgi:hypothetical protein